ncbi:MAG: AsnC family transcriptional regulator [Candidatus Epulonipiscioides saccharophilum]|nr:MAG: AsnC family transcriptional regulator [Epulopiscium sp. AS2M-Bin001]
MKTKILKLLEGNAKYSIEDLAIILDSTPEIVSSIIAQLEDEQIICGYKTLINWDKITETEIVTALVEVQITPSRGTGFDRIAQRLSLFKEVEALYLMSGGFDLTVIVKSKTLKEVATFVSQKLAVIDEVLTTRTHFVLKRYKDHSTIFEQAKVDQRMVVSP